MLEVIEQTKQGVLLYNSCIGFLLKFMPHVAKRKMGIVSSRGSFNGPWDDALS